MELVIRERPSDVLRGRTPARTTGALCELLRSGRVFLQPPLRRGHTTGTPGCEPWGNAGAAVRPEHRNGGRFAPGHALRFPQTSASGAKLPGPNPAAVCIPTGGVGS